MKATELRIGNWIRLKSKNKFYQIDSGHDIEEIDDAPKNFDAIPIPLTEKWLLKFGFNEEKDRIDIFEMGRLRIWKDYEGKSLCYLIDEDNTNAHYLTPINYVHQLQNLYFSLTGEELLIK